MIQPCVSIIMLTFNQLRYTQQALKSVFAKTPEMLELIVIDNASEDSTPAWLLQQIPQQPRLKVLLNQQNVGFAQGCNQGLQLAQGRYVLILNNDVLVTEGWLGRMLQVMVAYDGDIVGPMGTHFHGLQALTDMADANAGDLHPDGLEAYAQKRASLFKEQGRWVHRLLGTCLLMKREVFMKIGGFDPCFGLGYYEDDDFCYRALLAGFKLWLGYDLFIHHFGSKSFQCLPHYQVHLLRERNKLMFMLKWGVTEWPESWAREPILEIMQQSWHSDLFVPLSHPSGYV